MAPRMPRTATFGKGAKGSTEKVTFGGIQPPPATVFQSNTTTNNNNNNNNIFAVLGRKEKNHGEEKQDEAMGEASSPIATPEEVEAKSQQCSEQIKLGVVAFQEAINLANLESTKAALQEIIAYAVAIEQGRFVSSFSSTQEMGNELKAIRLSLTQLSTLLPQQQLQQQQQKPAKQKTYAQAATPAATATSTNATPTASATPASTPTPRLTVKQQQKALDNSAP